ncbi:MAG: 4-hydroxy-3-methylbut-2-enyl diphosphate reductase [Thermoanaerobaculia bacterium]|nr:4-hydroxy-3-methylbut-2-enyl diphosphate reductase [Thermoanaerobaculia bacterium]
MGAKTTVALKVKRAAKYGFCSGVRIADMKVKRFAAKGGKGAILGQVVHNERVVEEMEELGVQTIDSIESASGPTIVFSAHGVPSSFHERAEAQGLDILDTTCKFVYDIHRESRNALGENYHLVFIGESNHREVIGYTHDLDPEIYHIVSTIEDVDRIDWSKYPKVKVFYQTTLNAEEYEPVVRRIEKQVQAAERADTICYATKENQDAAKELANDPEVEMILVIGGRESANTRHLWEICREFKPSYLIHDISEIDTDWFEGRSVVGITAGSSTPDYMIDEIEEKVLSLA